jgi:hypothetical protein
MSWEAPTRTLGIGPQLPASGVTLDLGSSIRRFAKSTGEKIGKVHKNSCIALFNSIVYDTPIDTGTARGGWNPSLDRPMSGPLGRMDKGGAAVAHDIEVTIIQDWKRVAYLTNAVPYIVPLEYGWSQRQAPEGMVRINIIRFQTIVSQQVQKVRAGR